MYDGLPDPGHPNSTYGGHDHPGQMWCGAQMGGCWPSGWRRNESLVARSSQPKVTAVSQPRLAMK